MKVTVKSAPQEFKPQIVEIVIESRKEAEAYASLLGVSAIQSTLNALGASHSDLRNAFCKAGGEGGDYAYTRAKTAIIAELNAERSIP